MSCIKNILTRIRSGKEQIRVFLCLLIRTGLRRDPFFSLPVKSVNITAVVTVVLTVVITAAVTVVVTVVIRGNENHSPSSPSKSEVVRVSSRDVASTFSL